MATTIVLKDVHPGLDGDYELDLVARYFTNWELHAMKLLTGLTAGQIEDASDEIDNDVVVALTFVALMRGGKVNGRTPWLTEQADALWQAPVGSISVRNEGDASPPAEETSDSEPPSGESTKPSSDPQASDPSTTGDPE